MTATTAEPAFSEWAILELMGHRRLAGLVTECQVAGKGFLRLDVPAPVEHPGDQERWEATQYYSPDSVYCMTPVTETVARTIAARSKPQPATRWELEPARPSPGNIDEVFYDDVEDEDEDEVR